MRNPKQFKHLQFMNISFFAYTVKLVGLLVLCQSCATIVMPTGGPKDTTPPILLRSSPLDKEINFQKTAIKLSFDEFVELTTPNKLIQITPPTAMPLTAEIVGKSVILVPNQPLAQNTTYELTIGHGAIKDFAEGNPMPQLKYVFSTGSRIDSGKLEINATELWEQVPSQESVCVLVKTRDDFFRNQFQQITKFSNNTFNFNTLDTASYFLFAFIDSNQNRKWDRSEKIAFQNTKIKSNEKNIGINFFANEQQPIRSALTQLGPKLFAVKSSTVLQNLKPTVDAARIVQKSISEYYLFYDTKAPSDHIVVKYNNMIVDTLKIPISKIPFELMLLDNTTKIARMYHPESAEIEFNSLISKMDQTKIAIKSDGKSIKTEAKILDNKLVINNLDYSKEYEISIDSGAIYSQDICNTKKVSVKINTVAKETSWSNLTITSDKQPGTNVIYIKTEEGLDRIQKFPILLKNHVANKILFYVIDDANKNGIWDTGNVFRSLQPESIRLVSLDLVPNQSAYTIQF